MAAAAAEAAALDPSNSSKNTLKIENASNFPLHVIEIFQHLMTDLFGTSQDQY